MSKISKFVLQGKVPRQKRRALELFAIDSPFKPRKEETKPRYKRKAKHRNKEDE